MIKAYIHSVQFGSENVRISGKNFIFEKVPLQHHLP